jgi:transcription initiation factor TFIID subunit 5
LLKKFIDESLDIYNDELQSVLFPIFTELFLGMVKGRFLKEARKFFADEKYQF